MNKNAPWNNEKWRHSKNKKKIDNLDKKNNQKGKISVFSIPLHSSVNNHQTKSVHSFELPFQMLFSNKLDDKKNTNNLFESLLNKILIDEKKITSNKSENLLIKNNFKIDLKKSYEEIDTKINSIDDLIKLGKLYTEDHNYPIDLKKVHDIIPTLEKLKEIVGMKEVKKNIINQIVYFISCIDNTKNMMHTVITGPPGVGKTMLGHIIGEIYYKLGILDGAQLIFRKVKRSDLIGEYMGHTAIKTQNVINECAGGVLFIDEAYSLGSGEKKDIYSKECIDTLNQNLTENKNNFVCIIAGYKDDLEKCFFSVNEGLRRRFPFRYNIEKYSSNELCQILLKFIDSEKWSLDDSLEFEQMDGFMKKNYNNFPNFGGDIENYFFNVRIAHAYRTFGKLPKFKKKITLDDFKKGMDIFLESKEKNNNLYESMYL